MDADGSGTINAGELGVFIARGRRLATKRAAGDRRRKEAVVAAPSPRPACDGVVAKGEPSRADGRPTTSRAGLERPAAQTTKETGVAQRLGRLGGAAYRQGESGLGYGTTTRADVPYRGETSHLQPPHYSAEPPVAPVPKRFSVPLSREHQIAFRSSLGMDMRPPVVEFENELSVAEQRRVEAWIKAAPPSVQMKFD